MAVRQAEEVVQWVVLLSHVPYQVMVVAAERPWWVFRDVGKKSVELRKDCLSAGD